MRSLDAAAEVADRGLHPLVRSWVPRDERLEALREELEWSLTTAATDLEFARRFAADVPVAKQPPEAFLNRWVEVSPDLSVLVGPRFRGLDPDLPFVSVDAATRVIVPGDLPMLRSAALRELDAFGPKYVRLWGSSPPYAWPGTRPDNRDVVGRLGDLRARTVPAALTARPAHNLDFYDRYLEIHQQHVAADPEHAVHTRAESRADLAALLAAGTVFDVLRNGSWVGVLAAAPDTRLGMRGFTVVELLLDPSVRGHGYGRHLSALLAASLPAPDQSFLIGTIHAANLPSYRSALAAGRVDVGGEIICDLG